VIPRRVVPVVVLVVLLAVPGVALAQKSLAEVLGRTPTPEGQPKSYLEEIVLFSYVENSYVFNLSGAGRDAVNELRYYDFDEGWSFNMAELSIKKDPSDARPWGFGLVITGGTDAQKNHVIGIFRDDDDAFPFRNTFPLDLQEAYASYKFPVGNGLTLKAGKFVTLLGYEVIESPLNLNFSRSNLFVFSAPFTHVGALLSYPVVDGLTLTAGPVVGWDVADDNNDAMSVMGQIAFTGIKDLTTSFNFITGPEQFDRKSNPRTVLDLVVNYTGIKGLTLGANLDWGFEVDEASLRGSGTRSGNDAHWWGYALYAAYDWTEKLRTALRFGYFKDADGVRTLAVAPGSKVSLYDVTATAQYKVWRGLVGRVEYRHDQADERVFKIKNPGPAATSKHQDTISVVLSYLFF
jgi:hypothetical protein